MEIIFKNQLIYTKQYYKEYYEYICFKKPTVLIVDIIFSISFIISIISMIFPKLAIIYVNTAMANIATLLILLFFQIYLFFRNKNLAYNRDLERNNDNPIQVELLITEETVTVCTNCENNINIEFSNIEKVVRTKNYYILVSKSKFHIPLKKDGFTKGTAKQFEQFLKQKKL